ncbi:dihydroxyacetone kinase [Cordyceps fumosorosea ARSEF 2679]|uniref:Dihydroxyacetone kinase n=1 Tax=Cordyceps fumosorosea (strain ARSEF 2679) TaxID=1081104 RepID=A0A168EQ22_CORFA|nr:dihydroxyacetone kinase [Cordyceps fumosorosea ARSEF 2679]OAA74086.1 dihydroxyacetone kinase [Cordyceps fumosorosea ARSEF 2679]
MSSRHFIDDATHLVNTALHSLTLTNPHVALDAEHKIVYRRASSYAAPQVALLSGGGSGHEPSFAGMVGPGMLSAAVAGTVFASPSAEQVRRAILTLTRQDAAATRGVLVVVMNYTGDVLNFGMAVEKARAAGVDAEMVIVGDDVGVGRAQAGKVGRRGIAGTVLVLKIAGAMAARGAAWEDVLATARRVAGNVVSVGASLEHVHVPGRAADEDGSGSGMARGEVEIGMGIHNEAGCEKARLELPALVGRMLAQLLDTSDKDRGFLVEPLGPGATVVLLVNNLGGVSVLEMGGITAEVVAQLRERYGIRPARVIAGTFMTSLNGMGFSISLLDVRRAGGASVLELLDAPSEVTGWSAPISTATWEAAAARGEESDEPAAAAAVVQEEEKPSGLKHDAAASQAALTAALKSVIAAEPDLTRYDTVVGDGDCGIGLKRGAEAVLKHLEEHPFTGDLAVDVARLVPVVEGTMDGTSGALYAIFLNALVHALRGQPPGEATPQVWVQAFEAGFGALSQYTPARQGDRTLVDALYPFMGELMASGDVRRAARASRAGAEATKGMKASLGRSVYVGGSGYEEVPDPGAWGLACFFDGLAGN